MRSVRHSQGGRKHYSQVKLPFQNFFHQRERENPFAGTQKADFTHTQIDTYIHSDTTADTETESKKAELPTISSGT